MRNIYSTVFPPTLFVEHNKNGNSYINYREYVFLSQRIQ